MIGWRARGVADELELELRGVGLVDKARFELELRYVELAERWRRR